MYIKKHITVLKSFKHASQSNLVCLSQWNIAENLKILLSTVNQVMMMMSFYIITHSPLSWARAVLIVSWDFAGAVSIFGPDALPVVHQ